MSSRYHVITIDYIEGGYEAASRLAAAVVALVGDHGHTETLVSMTTRDEGRCRTDRDHPTETHPLARWLRRTADLLDRIYVRRCDPVTGRWGNAALAELEFEEAATHVARWLLEGHVPVAAPPIEKTQ